MKRRKKKINTSEYRFRRSMSRLLGCKLAHFSQGWWKSWSVEGSFIGWFAHIVLIQIHWSFTYSLIKAIKASERRLNLCAMRALLLCSAALFSWLLFSLSLCCLSCLPSFNYRQQRLQRSYWYKRWLLWADKTNLISSHSKSRFANDDKHDRPVRQ